MPAEKLSFKNPGQEKLHSLTQTQEQTAQNIYVFLNGFIGDVYLFGRKVKIISGPKNFILTVNNDDNSQIILNTNEFDSDFDLTKVKSKHTLSHLKFDGKTGRSLTTYRFNQDNTFKKYQNGEVIAEISQMHEEDFQQVQGFLETINQYVVKH